MAQKICTDICNDDNKSLTGESRESTRKKNFTAGNCARENSLGCFSVFLRMAQMVRIKTDSFRSLAEAVFASSQRRFNELFPLLVALDVKEFSAAGKLFSFGLAFGV